MLVKVKSGNELHYDQLEKGFSHTFVKPVSHNTKSGLRAREKEQLRGYIDEFKQLTGLKLRKMHMELPL